MMFETLIYLDQFEMTNLDQIKIVHCKTGHNDVHKFCFICSYVLYACTISILVFQGQRLTIMIISHLLKG